MMLPITLAWLIVASASTVAVISATKTDVFIRGGGGGAAEEVIAGCLFTTLTDPAYARALGSTAHD